MKTKPVIHKFIFSSISAMIISALTTGVYAQAADTTPVDFRYVGKLNDQPLFQLNISNPNNDAYTIKVFDEDGYIFYYNIVRSKSFSKKFQLEADDLPKGLFNVEIRSKNKNTVEVFRVTRSSRFVQETSISKL